MTVSERKIRRAVQQVLDELPADKMAEVLDFALFLKKRWAEKGAATAPAREPMALTLRSVPASHLDGVTGLVAWGGDARLDAERLYDDEARQSRN